MTTAQFWTRFIALSLALGFIDWRLGLVPTVAFAAVAIVAGRWAFNGFRGS